MGEKSMTVGAGEEQIKLHVDAWRKSSSPSPKSHLEYVLQYQRLYKLKPTFGSLLTAEQLEV